MSLGTTVRELDRAECLLRLSWRPFGRLVYTHRALPEVLPVNFRLGPDYLLVRLARGSRVAEAVIGSVVAFQVDDIDVDRRLGWSVNVVGAGVGLSPELTGPAVDTWIEGPHEQLVRIGLDRVTGRELERTPEEH